MSFLTTSLPGYDNPNQDMFNDKSIEIKTPPRGGERVDLYDPYENLFDKWNAERIADRLVSQRAECVHDSLIRSEYTNEQDRQRR